MKIRVIMSVGFLLAAFNLSAQEFVRLENEKAEAFAKRIKPMPNVLEFNLAEKVVETKLWDNKTPVIFAFYNVLKNESRDERTEGVGYAFVLVRPKVYKAILIDFYFAPFDSLNKVESIFFANADRDEQMELLIITSGVLDEDAEQSGTWFHTYLYDNIDVRNLPAELLTLREFEQEFEGLDGFDTEDNPTKAQYKTAADVKKKLKTLRHQMGYDFSYPVIKSKGAAYTDFIPQGWVLLDSATGDLNKDGASDMALVLQYKDSVNTVILLYGYEFDTLKSQPRILLILLRNKTANTYYKAEQSDSFILQHDNPNAEDPFSDISIAKGVIKIEFRFFMNMGSWSASSISYKFRYQNNQFVLIGEDYYSRQRNTGESDSYSINYLTGKKCTTTETMPDMKPMTECKTIVVKLRTLKTFKHSY